VIVAPAAVVALVIHREPRYAKWHPRGADEEPDYTEACDADPAGAARPQIIKSNAVKELALN
jgi:hypothetical protein